MFSNHMTSPCKILTLADYRRLTSRIETPFLLLPRLCCADLDGLAETVWLNPPAAGYSFDCFSSIRSGLYGVDHRWLPSRLLQDY